MLLRMQSYNAEYNMHSRTVLKTTKKVTTISPLANMLQFLGDMILGGLVLTRSEHAVHEQLLATKT